MEYIKYHNLYLCHRESINSLVTAFELQKNGLVHSHSICEIFPGNVQDVRSYLITKFASTASRAAVAVDVQPVRNLQKVIDYINKDYIAQFSIGIHSPFASVDDPLDAI
jgi:hypothetical protein